MRNFDRDMFGSGPGGFTLVEMLVAVAMGAALVAGAAAVFSLAGEAVGTSQAITELNSQIRIVHSWLDRDFGRIRLDGPLVIIPQDIDYTLGDNSLARADRVAFLASGHFVSLSPQSGPTVHSSLAVLVYGQDDRVGSLPGNPSGDEMSDLVLTRHAVLVVGDGAPGSTGDDLMPGSFGDFLYGWYNIGPWDSNQVIRVNLNATPYSRLVEHVLSFKVLRYAIYDENGEITYVDNIDTGTPVEQLRFEPHQNKPLWIDFEIIMRDSRNRMKDDFVSTYRVNLPTR